MPTSHDITLDTPLRVSTTAVSTAIPGETVILDPTSGRYFGLDGVGTLAWEMLHAPTTLRSMITAITAEYDVDTATCESDLRTLLAQLDTKGLVVVGEAEV